MTRARTAAGIVAVGLLTAACSSGGGGGDTPAPSGTGPAQVDGAGKTLTVWIMEGTNADATSFFAKVKSTFKAQTGADVDVQMVPWTSAHDKFTTSFAGGTSPDVAEVGATWTAEFADAGALLDVSDKVKAAGGADALNQGLVDYGTWGGKLYGVPWYAGVRSFVYRKDLFAAAGVTSTPTSWAELTAAAQKVKAANPNLTAMPIAGNAELTLYPFVWGAGGDIATQSGNKFTCALTSDKARAGIQAWADFALKDGLSNPSATTWTELNLRDSFTAGQSAIIESGSWTPAAILAKNPDLKDKLGVFEIPGESSGTSPAVIGGSHLSVFETSKNPDLAWEFVKLMAYGQFAKDWGTQSGFFPAQNSLLQDVIASKDPVSAPFAQQYVDGKALPVTPAFGKIQGAKVVTTMMQSILSGKASVADATTTACDAMDKTFSAT